MRIDRQKFFDGVRGEVHKGHLSQDQVASYEAILDACDAFPITDPRHIAYVLATARGEVGIGMQPIPEMGKGKGRPYGKADPATNLVYYGRGFVQLTWAKNYQTMGRRIGADLYRNPDLALDRATAAKIIVIGMAEGSFTGKKLADYIAGPKADYESARRIINGTDRAAEFAGFARQYHAALTAALVNEEVKGGDKDQQHAPSNPAPAPDLPSAPAPTPVPPPKPRVSAVQWIIGAVAAALTFIFAWIFTGGPN